MHDRAAFLSGPPRAFAITDVKGNGKVRDVYSDVPGGTPPYEYDFGDTGQSATEEFDYNREHSWSQSGFNGVSPPYSDPWNLYPTDAYLNNRRANDPFGNVGPASWTSQNGSKLGTSTGHSGTVFAPIDAFHGDLVRSTFYRSTRYFNEDGGWSNSAATDSAELLLWAVEQYSLGTAIDPVSWKERLRNGAIYVIQNNWNPFGTRTTIGFDLARREQITLRIFDVTGRRVRTLANGNVLESGRHRLEWNGRDEGGAQLVAGPANVTRCMVLARGWERTAGGGARNSRRCCARRLHALQGCERSVNGWPLAPLSERGAMMAAHPELVVMAAGVGSRFGGLKQLEPVGPGGEKLIDYSIFDALRAGVERVVFVIRREMETDFHALVGARFTGRAEVVYAHQELDDVPAGFVPPVGRSKPWGTAHAILAARQAVRAPFLVINADDFYGAAAYGVTAEFLRAPVAAPPERWAMVGYHLANTLSAHGTVSRGVCAVGADGLLRDIVERGALAPCDGGASETGPDGADRRYAGDTPVSMNFWAFTPAIFPHLTERFARFLDARGQDLKSEFYIPAVVKELMDEGLATVRVLDSPDPWFGLTYREDRDAVAARLRALIARGDYPPRLWG